MTAYRTEMMKPRLHILLLVVTWPLMAHAGNELKLLPLSGPPKSDTEIFFPVKEGGTRIDGEVIREFALSGDRVTVAYKNSTDEALSPEYIVRIYNRFGILIGSDKVSPGLLGGSPRLEPGDVGGERIHIEWLDLNSIFRHATSGELPEDFDRAEWLSVSDSNSKVETDADGPPTD